MDAATDHRRWFQFSLRTMLVLFFLISVSFGWWVNRSREWIRQRHELLQDGDVGVGVFAHPTMTLTHAPGWLWLFGENGVGDISVYDPDEAVVARTKQLYPEATIIDWTRGVRVQQSVTTTSGK